jgi:hypothetical protein
VVLSCETMDRSQNNRSQVLPPQVSTYVAVSPVWAGCVGWPRQLPCLLPLDVWVRYLRFARFFIRWYDDSPPPLFNQLSLTSLTSLPHLRRLTGNFGGRFSWMMVSVYFGVKGILYNLVDLARLPYFSTMLKVTGERYQSYGVRCFRNYLMRPACSSRMHLTYSCLSPACGSRMHLTHSCLSLLA